MTGAPLSATAGRCCLVTLVSRESRRLKRFGSLSCFIFEHCNMLKQSHNVPVLSLSNQVYTCKFFLQFLFVQSHNILSQRTLNILSGKVTPMRAAKSTVVSNCPSHSLLSLGKSGMGLNYSCDATSMNTSEFVFIFLGS